MTTHIDPAKLTPEGIIAAAKRHRLKLMPGRYLSFDGQGRPVGCCAMAAVAINADPNVIRTNDFTATLHHAGLGSGANLEFRCGVTAGFDGKPRSKAGSERAD